MASVRGYGTYLPLYRIERSAIAEQHGGYARGGEIAVPGHDENVVTLAVNALQTALNHAGNPEVDAVYAATTSDPFDERGVAAHIAHATGAHPDARAADFQGSARAATAALLAARDAIDAGRIDTAAVVATDALAAYAGQAGEQTAGAGAGALVLDPDGEVATVDGAASATTGFVGRFKRAGEPPVEGDGRFNRERYVETVAGAVGRLVEETGVEPVHAVAPAPDGRWGGRALGATDVDAEIRSSFQAIGYAGAASVLVDTALAFEHAGPDEGVLVVSYGPGGGDAVALSTGPGTEHLPAMTTQEYIESKEYVSYAKHLEFRQRAWGEA